MVSGWDNGRPVRPATKRLVKRALGTSDIATAGWRWTMRGLRTGEQRDLYLGLGLAALSFLRRTAPRKRLLFRKSLPEGSALVIDHRGTGDPRITVTRA
jgi:hypothetical protein